MQFNTMPHFWFDYVRQHPVVDKDASDEVEVEVEDDDPDWTDEDDLDEVLH